MYIYIYKQPPCVELVADYWLLDRVKEIAEENYINNNDNSSNNNNKWIGIFETINTL